MPLQPQVRNWNDQPVLVTGAAGFLGSRLVRRLADAGAIVHTLTRPSRPPAQIPENVRMHPADITDPVAVAGVVETVRPSIVFHLAAYGTLPGQTEKALMERVNVGGTRHVLDACRAAGGPIVVYPASCSELTLTADLRGADQRMLYAATKFTATRLCEAYQREGTGPCIIARLFTAYGPGEPAHRLIPSVARALLSGRSPRVTSGEQRRDFVYIDDLIEGLTTAALAPEAVGQILDLGTGHAVRVKDVVQTLIDISDNSVQAEYGAVEKRSDDRDILQADPVPAARMIGWRAKTSLEDGLRKTWDWFKRMYAEEKADDHLTGRIVRQ